VHSINVKVRGAPAIAVVGVLSLVVEIYEKKFVTTEEFYEYIKKRLDYLVSARPTAVNIADSRVKLLNQLQAWIRDTTITVEDLKARFELILRTRLQVILNVFRQTALKLTCVILVK